MKEITLPDAVNRLYAAQLALQQHFAQTRLAFTLDGKLVGDIGEAIVAEAYGITLCQLRTRGVDGHTAGGRSVQIKTTGRARAGPAFTPGEGVADYLIFIRIDFSVGIATVLYNGPEAPVRKLLPESWSGTKELRLSGVLKLDASLQDGQRLARL